MSNESPVVIDGRNVAYHGPVQRIENGSLPEGADLGDVRLTFYVRDGVRVLDLGGATLVPAATHHILENEE